MRALLLYLLAGLAWAILGRQYVLAYNDPIFWRDVAVWPVMLVLEAIELRHLVPHWIQQWAMIGVAVAAVGYVMLGLDFGGSSGEDGQGRRRRRPG